MRTSALKSNRVVLKPDIYENHQEGFLRLFSAPPPPPPPDSDFLGQGGSMNCISNKLTSNVSTAGSGTYFENHSSRIIQESFLQQHLQLVIQLLLITSKVREPTTASLFVIGQLYYLSLIVKSNLASLYLPAIIHNSAFIATCSRQCLWL